MLILLALVLVSALAALSIGPSPVPVTGVVRSLLGMAGARPEWRTIVIDVRLPRVLLGLIVGLSLGAGGAAFQSLLRNPLADPYVLGVSGGAACGTCLALLLGLEGWAFLLSFVGAGLSLFGVYGLARYRGRMPTDTVLLAGVIVGTFLGGVVMLLMAVSGQELQRIVYLLMGSLGVVFSGKTAALVGAAAAISTLGVAGLWLQARELDLFSLGEDVAQTTGVDAERLKRRLFLLVSLMVGAVVSLSGCIGFVGLVVPHLVRLACGPSHRWLIPASALGGAALLILADTAARSISPWEIPVGVVTALVGVPFFVFLLQRRKRAGNR
jgi:iron complex transport system permease protein